MERVTEYFPGEDYATKVWISDQGRKDLRKTKPPPQLMALFEGRADKGFKDYVGTSLRKEGEGVWAFGPSTWTNRIAGYFPDETRAEFIIGGAWKGSVDQVAAGHSAQSQ